MQTCCLTGFQWNGSPKGRESRLEDHDVYITGDNPSSAVLFLSDAFGWKFRNQRLLADHLAQEIGATVYLPDFFRGTALDTSHLRSPDEESKYIKAFDWKAWLGQNSPSIRMPAVVAFAQYLRQQYKKVAAVGYCWGGKPALQLTTKEHTGLLDCISIGHPSLVTEEDLRSVMVPIQILAPENDHAFSPEMKRFANEIIPTLGVAYSYQHFPGVRHGFAIKCDETNAKEKRALELAKNATVYWISAHFV